MSDVDKKEMFPYLHGFSQDEQDRLRQQARFGEQVIYQDIDFTDCKNILEVGCGVGAQTEILLRRFPDLHVTGIDLSEKQLEAAKNHFENKSLFENRYKFQSMNAENLDFKSNTFDGAFLCWVLEHVPNPTHILNEVRRVLKPGAPIFITEVMNATFFLDPYSPNLWKYWMAFNDYQYNGAGDPFIGAKLGNFLTSQNFKDIITTPKTWFLDKRHPEKRKEIIGYWLELVLSASEQLVEAKYIEEETVKKAIQEVKDVQKNPDAVFYDSFMQASARKS